MSTNKPPQPAYVDRPDRSQTMDIGHPVTLRSGAHGVITALADGITRVELLGGGEASVPLSSLRSYFDNPMPSNAQAMQMKRERADFPKLVRGRRKRGW